MGNTCERAVRRQTLRHGPGSPCSRIPRPAHRSGDSWNLRFNSTFDAAEASMAGFVGAFFLLAGSYLVFAGQVSGHEIGLAALFGAAASLWWAALQSVAGMRFRLELKALAEVARALALLPLAVLKVGGTLILGLFRPPGSEAVRRAFAHGGRDELLLHEMVKSPVQGDARWPA